MPHATGSYFVSSASLMASIAFSTLDHLSPISSNASNASRNASSLVILFSLL